MKKKILLFTIGIVAFLFFHEHAWAASMEHSLKQVTEVVHTQTGMFTVLMVRDNLKDYDHPGDYPHPKGTVAEPVNEDK